MSWRNIPDPASGRGGEKRKEMGGKLGEGNRGKER